MMKIFLIIVIVGHALHVDNPSARGQAGVAAWRSAYSAGHGSPGGHTGDQSQTIAASPAESGDPSVHGDDELISIGVSRAEEFDLEDQYGRTHAHRFPREKAMVLLFGDRQGATQLEGWIRPLYKRYRDRIDIEGVAVVSAVPEFARSMVRAFFRSAVGYPVMLDWAGTVSQRYGFEKDKANLFVIGADGEVHARVTGRSDSQRLAHVFDRIDSLLASSGRKEEEVQ